MKRGKQTGNKSQYIEGGREENALHLCTKRTKPLKSLKLGGRKKRKQHIAGLTSGAEKEGDLFSPAGPVTQKTKER